MNRFSKPSVGLQYRIRRSCRTNLAILLALFPGLFLWCPGYSNPSGASVVHGNVQFSGRAGNLQIRQNSSRAIINWDSFSIGAGEITQFRQLNSRAAVLNRVTGGDPTEILGALRANGNVIVINPNGILVGAGGRIDVHGLVLSTLDVDNGEFLAGGDMVFRGDSGAGVTNLGRINGIGGDVFLIGKTVTNSGNITASGTVGLAAGEEVLLTAAGNAEGERMFVRAGGSGASGTGVLNDGTIQGAAAELKAHGNVYALAINNKGSIRATGASSRGGSVFLTGTGGNVRNSGDISVRSPGAGRGGRAVVQAAMARVDGMIRAEAGDVRISSPGGSAEIGGVIDVSSSDRAGGTVTVEAENVEVGAGGEINASGESGGGLVRIGGGFQGQDSEVINSESTLVSAGAVVRADALQSGDGGRVIIWSDGQTEFEGEVSAAARYGEGAGGYIEVSGRDSLLFDGFANASAVSGRRGTVLFDPGTMTVGGAGSTMTIAAVNSTLDTNTNVTLFTGSGDIVFESLSGDFRDVSVQWNTDADLGVFASGDVIFNNHARSAGAGSVNVIAGWDGTEADAAILANDPEAAWSIYVAAGQYGIDDGDPATGVGNVVLDAVNRAVEVGSRYGLTNIAGNEVSLIAGNSGRRHVHLGFRDNGQVFYFDTSAYNGVANAGDPLVGMVGVHEDTVGGERGVYLFDSAGASTHFVRYADDFGADGPAGDDGNWWWRSLDGLAGGSSGMGDYLPEMGAGQMAAPADITIRARGKLEVLAGSSGTGDYESNYAQVGHGGNARGWDNVNRRDSGRDYSVNWGDRSSFSASMGRLAGVYGGIDIEAGGTVEVSASSGAPGRRNNNYAQVGHGGTAQIGLMEGGIKVLAGGAVGVNGGNGWRGHAQIGHSSTGGNTDVDQGLGKGSITQTGQTPDGKLGGGQFKQIRIFANDSDFNDTNLLRGDLTATIVATTTGPNYTGDASLYAGTAAVTGEDPVNRVDTAMNGDITVDSATGAVTVRSFDGRTVADAEHLQYSYSQIGHVGMSNTLRRVSASGTIDVSGTEILFRGGNNANQYAYAQLGHGGATADGNFSGDIIVTADTGKVEFMGGVDSIFATTGRLPDASDDGTPLGSYAQLGHGGYDADGSHSGNIVVNAGSNAGIGLRFEAGNTTGAYVQLGHGGINSRSSLTADPQGFVGNITVNSTGTIQFTAGAGLDDGAFDSDHNLSAHLGHGGYDADAANSNTDFFSDPDWGHSGSISVTSTEGDILFSGGGNGAGADNTGRFHWVQLGHGGYAAGGNHHGSITVEATDGDIRFAAGGASVDDSTSLYNYALLGHGGAEDRGNLGLATDVYTVSAGGNVSFLGGDLHMNFAQLGNGGYNFAGDHSGSISLTAGGTAGISLLGGEGNYAKARVGHGGHNSDGDHTGSIQVMTDGEGDVLVTGGEGYFASAQIGHGGDYSSGSIDSSITVTAGDGDVRISGGGDSGPGSNGYSWAQIGHGGYQTLDFHQGAIGIEATGVILSGGTTGQSYSQIGHGGYNSDSDHAGTIGIDAGTGGVSLSGGSLGNTYAMIGGGGGESQGDNMVSITLESEGSVSLTGGRGSGNSFAQIGNGGSNADGDHSGEIRVLGSGSSAVDILAGSGSGSYNYAMIGHAGTFNGGFATDGGNTVVRKTMQGDITVTSGSGGVNLVANSNSYFAHAMIGHGGRDSHSDKTGNITVTAADGGVNLTAGKVFGSARYAHAQIGHGGYRNAENRIATGPPLVLGPDYNDFTHSGDIVVKALGSGGVSVKAGENYGAYAMIGHGGFGAGVTPEGDLTGSVTVIAEQDILVEAGTQSYTFAQIGHGGRNYDGDHGLAGEQISVVSNSGNIELLGGVGSDSTALIGHGDKDDGSGRDRKGDILVSAANGELSMVSNGGNVAYIGHRTTSGGVISDADVTIVAGAVDGMAGDQSGAVFDVDDSFGNMLQSNLAGGDVSIVATGTGGLAMNSTGNMVYDSGNDFAMLSNAGVYVSNDVLNRGGGNIHIVAGYDAASAPLVNEPLAGGAHGDQIGGIISDIDIDTAIFGVDDSFGNGDGSVWVGANPDLSGADTGVIVGSNDGQTNVAAHDVNVWGGAVTGGVNTGSRKYSQIGFSRRDAGGSVADPVTGRIKVVAKNDIDVDANHYAIGTLGYGGWTDRDHSGYASYAQIGHGGDRDSIRNMSLSGEIIVEAGNNLQASGGRTRENYAMIGHGGYDNPQAASTAQLGGEITVLAGNDLSLIGGEGLYAHAQIGHGGGTHRVASFSASDITVDAGGNIRLTGGPGGAGGSSNYAFAMIGHGGYDSDVLTASEGYSGKIDIDSGGEVILTAGGGGSTQFNFSGIGHGGSRSSGDHSGVICVVAMDGVSLDAASVGGTNSHVQIGHGGTGSPGNLDGDITVMAPSGAVLLTGGNSDQRYAQIGHGGALSSGDLSGNLNVVAGDGVLSLAGGGGTSAYAMTGHGEVAAASSGTRAGGVHLFSGAALTATDGSGTDSGARVFHQSGGGLSSVDYLGGDGFQIVGNGGVTLSDGSLSGVQSMIDGNIGNGPISLAFSNDVDLTIGAGNDFSVDTSDDFYLLTGGDITFLSSYQNAGTGNITLVAGWNGVATQSPGSVTYTDLGGGMFNYCEPVITEGDYLVDFANCETFGNNDSVLTIGSTSQTAAVAVGSAYGNNTFAGAGVEVLAGGTVSDAFTRLGYRADGTGPNPVTGSIGVFSKGGGLTLTSGAGEGSYTQVGHGTPGGTGVEVDASISISFCEPVGDLLMTAGSGAGAFSQVGHGGLGVSGILSGLISIDSARNVTVTGGGNQSYGQVGHGGASGTEGIDASGDPTFPGPRALTATGDVSVLNTTGAVSLAGGGGTENAYSQIGHGGVAIAAGGTIGGAVSVDAATGGVTLQGGTGSTAYAMIGNGGYQISSAIEGAVSVRAKGTAETDGVSLFGGDGAHTYSPPRSGYSGAMIGNGGYLATSTVGGSTLVTVENGGLSLIGGDGYFGNATIGHASLGTGAAYSGNVEVAVTQGDILVEAGSGEWFSFAQIGHGGWDRRDHSGEISVAASSGDVTVRGGDGTLYNFAKIGHGGYGNGSIQTNTGAISVESTSGDVRLDGRGGRFGFTQIGHGGLGKGGFMRGEYRDAITVTAGQQVELAGGTGQDTFAMIGHGGTNARGTMSGQVNVTAGAEGIAMTGGGGPLAFTQIGHGGGNEAGTDGIYSIASADVIVEGGKIAMSGGSNDYSYSMVGHGGGRLYGSSTDSNITVTTTGTGMDDGVSLLGGSDESAFAMIGSGGRAIDFAVSGDIAVTSAGGGVTLQGASTRAFSMIGHGGYEVDGAISGKTTVISNGGTANDGILLRGGGGSYAFANIGHANANATGSMLLSDTIVQIEGGGLIMEGGAGTLAQAAIGMQSRNYFGDRSGDVTVTVDSGDVILSAGDGTAAQSQIGHGGYGLGGDGILSGDISLTVSDGALSLTGGDAGYSSYAMLGSGGSNAHTGDITGSVTADVSGDISLTGGQGRVSFVQIGHGGDAYSGDLGGVDDSISVTSRTGGVFLTGGGGSENNAYAMIGMGGLNSLGDKVGDITINTVTGMSLSGVPGTGTASFAKVGHGGHASDATGALGVMEGDITFTASGGGSALSLTGGEGSYHYVQLGHGGYSSSGEKAGLIDVEVGSGGVSLLGGGTSAAGGNSHSFAQIGHGGTERSEGPSIGAIEITTSGGGDVILHGGGMRHSHSQIGHGGRSSANLGLQEGNITILSDGKVELKGSVDRVSGGASLEANETFAQIGHGGMFTSATYDGTINVTAATGVLLESGASHYNRAQIGHGGYGAGTNAGNGVVMADADVSVSTTSGGVILDATRAVNRAYSAAQIGNGGTGLYNAARAGAFRGDLFVDGGTGNVELHGGNRSGSTAQIGNGGTGLAGDHSGSIEVSAEGDLIIDLASGGTANRYARIGHGGIGATTSGTPLSISGNMSGEICVHVGGGIELSALGGTAENAFVQIGHGGTAVSGNFDGEITAVALGTGGISLQSGSGTGSFSQIGHGGLNTAGTMTGDLSVVAATGDTVLAGGAGDQAYSMLGHGDGSKTSTGQRGGGVHLFSQGTLSGSNGVGAGSDVYIFHQNNNGLQDADYLGGDGYQKVANSITGIDLPSSALVDESTMINRNIGLGTIQILDRSDRDYVIDASNIGNGMVNTSNDFQIITGGSITMLTSYQNAGTGDVTLVAGWDGDVDGGIQEPGSVSFGDPVDFCNPVISVGGFAVDFNNCDSFGNNGKTLTIGSATQTSRVSVGSAGGTNTFAGAGIELIGSDTDADAGSQLGFYGDGTAATGRLDLHVRELGLKLTSGAADGAFTQIGHGGTFSNPAGGVAASISISFCEPADLHLIANSLGVGSYAQIGHGGNNWDGSKSGDVTIEGARDVALSGGARDSYAQIGHGGAGVSDAYGSGTTGGKIEVLGTTGKVGLTGGGGLNATAQIGHGGVAMRGAMSGDVTVEAGTGGVEMQGSTGTRTYAMIGHGGYNNDFQMDGDVIVRATGTEAGDGLAMTGGVGSNSGAYIGNGGFGNETTMNGATTVEVARGGILMTGGDGPYANVAIGHYNRGGTSAMNGAIDVTVTEGDIHLIGNDSTTGYFSHARIGHGGWDSGDKTGAISVIASKGDIFLTGGQGNTSSSRYNFTQIGHGGYGNGAVQNIEETIGVTASDGSITLQGGTAGTSFSQVGHGGLGFGSFLAGSFGGNITLEASEAVSLSGGNRAYAHALIGNGGTNTKGPISGDVLVEAGTGGVSLNGGAGSQSFAVIGNSGYDSDHSITGSTTVRALGTNGPTDGIRLKGGEGTLASAQIGHLHAYGPGAVSGNVDVSAIAGGISLAAGDTGYFSHAMIGHGGRDSDGDKSGTVTVVANEGDVSLRAGGNHGESHYAHAQIGHGGYANGVIGRSYSDDVYVEAKKGNVSVTGGEARYDYAQIGHGGTSAGTGMSVSLSGEVEVRAASDVVVQGGSFDTTYAQIGHGGHRLSGTALSSIGGAVNGSTITVDAGQDVIIKAGSASNSAAKIGHGNNRMPLSEFAGNDISVNAGRHVELVSPQFMTYTGVSSSNTQIGHGGVGATVDGGDSGYHGAVTVSAGGKLDLLAATNATTFNYSLIGHTAYYDVRGSHSGDISVTVGTGAGFNDYGINLIAGRRTDGNTAASYYSFAAIGHRLHSNGNGGGDLSGSIDVTAERGGLILQGGEKNGAASDQVRLHAAQIGHGGYNSDGLKSGEIKVCIAEDITLRNGDARQSPVQIGHGGYNHNGDISGSVAASSSNGAISLDSTGSGPETITNTQIGHGGFATTGALSGDVSVSAPGSIRLTGGAGDGTHAQIGHGGDNSTGNFAGDIGVIAGGSLDLVGGSHGDGFSMVGHGSEAPTTSGTRSGSVKIAVGGNTFLQDNGSGVRLGHGTTAVNGISDSEFVLVTGTLDFTSHAPGVTGIVSSMIEGGDVTFAILDDDLLVDGGGAFYSSAFDANFVASGNVSFAASVQNAGSGSISAAAGWSSFTGFDSATNTFDGSNGLTLELTSFHSCGQLSALSFDFAALPADSDLWGDAGSSIRLGGATQAVAVGSMSGQTNAYADAVTIQAGAVGSNLQAQLGFMPASAGQHADGAISVGLQDGDLVLLGGDQVGSFAQLGHGGAGSATNTNLTGQIAIDFDGDRDGLLGSLSLTGGSGSRAYTQVGHGGLGHVGTKSSPLDISAGSIRLSGGGDDSYARLGHGGVSSSGSKSGDLTIEADTIALNGGEGARSGASIGHGGVRGAGDIMGTIDLATLSGDLSIAAGKGPDSVAQVGHGGSIYLGQITSQMLKVSSQGTIDLTGGEGLRASAQISHGGNSVAAPEIAGDINVASVDAITMTSGAAIGAYTQIGNGGGAAAGNFSGEITVFSGSEIQMSGFGASAAYSKIGHGDDFDSSWASISGTGVREGNIQVASVSSIRLSDSMIGHGNRFNTRATMGSGSTQVAVAVNSPTDPGSGSLIADSKSEFHGEEELRFYLPRRGNNRIAAGAGLNGASFRGAPNDPGPSQRTSEYTINIIGDRILFPNEHGNAFSTGPAPRNSWNFAFYYDTIELAEVDDRSSTADPSDLATQLLPLSRSMMEMLFPDDRTTDDWRRERERDFTGFNPFGIFYEGYEHYSSSGESTYSTGF